MRKLSLLSSRRRWLLAVGLLGASPLLCPCRGLHAQTASAAASAGADPTASTFYTSTTYLDLEGSGTTTHAEFGVLDFSTSALDPSGQTASGLQNNQLTLQFTESNAAFTAPSTLEFYLSTATSVSLAAGSPLRYQTANGTSAGPNPYGIDPLLGSLGGSGSTALFDLGSGTTSSTGSTGSGTVDTYTLTLSSSALTAFLSELNTAGSTVRLVAAVTGATPSGAATFAGVTNSTAANRPLLSFVPSFAVANAKYWQGGNGGSWTPTSTNFGASASTTGAAWVNDGTATAIFANAANTVNINAGNINAAGLEFDVTGYTINGTGAGNTLTLMGNHTLNVVNATDTATINAPIAGTAGLSKIGSGTLVLGGTNTYTGGTTITAGTLQVSADAALGGAGSAVVLAGGTLASGVTTSGGTLALTRGITGSGSLSVAANTTLSTSGVVNTGALTLTGGGTVLLTNTGSNTADQSNHAFTSVTFQTGGAALQTQNPNVSGAGVTAGLGIADLGGLAATNASGTTVTFAANSQVTGTIPVSVTNAGATLSLPGANAGAAVLAKTGAGTLVLGGDNSLLAGTGTTPASVRQGTAGTNPVSGGIISIPASNPNPGYALGTGQYQANGGTISNDTGGAITLQVSSISSGASTNAATPGGTVFAGNGAITVTGGVSLYKASSTTTSYQHGMTFNTPTTFTGLFTVSTGTGNSTGRTLAGSSTLTLGGTAGANTFTEPVTIATSGANAGVILGKDGALGANTAITINTGAVLTIRTGVTTGTVDAINNAALLTINVLNGAFGKLAFDLGSTVQETLGGLYLPTSDGVLPAGLQPAGTYGAAGSGAQHIDNNLFSGTGTINNLATAAVPEPSTWTLAAAGVALLGWLTRARRRAC